MQENRRAVGTATLWLLAAISWAMTAAACTPPPSEAPPPQDTHVDGTDDRTDDGADDGADYGADVASEVGVRSFGFAAVDCEYDDPLEPSSKSSYLDEVSGFTNVAHVCVTAMDMRERLRGARSHGLRALLQVESLLFEELPGQPPSGEGQMLALRPDAAQRWADFVRTNAEVLTSEYVAALFMADEPVWRGATPADIETACDLVAASSGAIPLVLIEAYTVLDRAVFPASLSWIGFDRYEVLDPLNSPEYQADLRSLRARRSRPEQQLVLVLEAKWLPYYGENGVTPERMADVAWSYFQLAMREPDVVALVGYMWPGGLDTPDQLGARNLPQSVQDTYREIGRRILLR